MAPGACRTHPSKPFRSGSAQGTPLEVCARLRGEENRRPRKHVKTFVQHSSGGKEGKRASPPLLKTGGWLPFSPPGLSKAGGHHIPHCQEATRGERLALCPRHHVAQEGCQALLHQKQPVQTRDLDRHPTPTPIWQGPRAPPLCMHPTPSPPSPHPPLLPYSHTAQRVRPKHPFQPIPWELSGELGGCPPGAAPCKPCRRSQALSGTPLLPPLCTTSAPLLCWA